MEFEIAKLDNIESSVSSNAPTDAPFIPRLQILYSLSQVMKDWKESEQGKKPFEGDFWLGPPGGVNFGRSVYIIPIALRDHALRYSGKNVAAESFKRQESKILPPNNKDEEIFREIENSPKQDQSKKQMNLWGVDTLFWLPPQCLLSVGTFAIFFFHSTARQETSKFKDSKKNVNNCGKLMILESKPVKSANFSWLSPEPSFPPPFNLADSEQVRLSEAIKNSIPAPETLKEEVTKFLNPSPQGRESVVQNPAGGVR